jgi:hypothetical protein
VAADIPSLDTSKITTGTLAIARGGTNTGSTLTGIVRGGASFSAAELSGDATTSGSNVVTVVRAAKTDALSTTGASVDVSGSAPSGSSQACVTTDATHCTWQTVSTGSSGNVTVAVKGDLQGYSTAPANLSVGTDGQAPLADSTAAVGLSYQWPGIGTLHVLKETVFAGITPQSFSNGVTYTIDGSGYTCTTGNGTVDIVTAGLQLRRNTLASSDASFNITPGNTGDFASIVGEARFRRGRWALWTRVASYNYTNASGLVYGIAADLFKAGTKWGVSLRREKNLRGAPNTATGGITVSTYWNGSEPAISSYPGVSTDDVYVAYARTPETIDLYHGVYSGGWPTMESMTMTGTIQLQTTQWVGTGAAPVAADVAIRFILGGAAASSGTYEIVIDRWRLVTYE